MVLATTTLNRGGHGVVRVAVAADESVGESESKRVDGDAGEERGDVHHGVEDAKGDGSIGGGGESLDGDGHDGGAPRGREGVEEEDGREERRAISGEGDDEARQGLERVGTHQAGANAEVIHEESSQHAVEHDGGAPHAVIRARAHVAHPELGREQRREHLGKREIPVRVQDLQHVHQPQFAGRPSEERQGTAERLRTPHLPLGGRMVPGTRATPGDAEGCP